MIGSREEARAPGPIYLIVAAGEVAEVAADECGVDAVSPGGTRWPWAMWNMLPSRSVRVGMRLSSPDTSVTLLVAAIYRAVIFWWPFH